MDLPKIKIGRPDNKKYLHDYSHDVSTTSDFGHLQPIMCRLMIPGTTFKDVDVDAKVRLAPLPVPTFARMKYKIFHQFVPIAELLHSFEPMMAGMTFNSPIQSYIPSSLPSISVSWLTKYILNNSVLTVWKCSTNSQQVVDRGGLGNLTVPTTSELSDVADVLRSEDSPIYVKGVTGIRLDIRRYVKSSPTARTSQSEYLPSLSTPVSNDFSFVYSEDDSIHYYITARFNRRMRNLRKVLIGCGFQLDLTNTQPLSIMPLFAYYKTCFDLFAVKRTVNYTSTAAFNLLESIALYNYIDLTSAYDNDDSFAEKFRTFLNDLSIQYYTKDPDFISAHTRTIQINQVATQVHNVEGGDNFELRAEQNNLPRVTASQLENGLTDVALRTLRFLQKFVNKNSVIGGRLSTYLKAHGLGDSLTDYDSNFIGSSEVDVQISDVMNTADSDYADLGEYAGKGTAFGRSQSFSFTANSFGYWVTVTALVPRVGYCQGIDPSLFSLTRMSLPQPELDALGYEITPRSAVITNGDEITTIEASSGRYDSSAGFGYLPRFSGYKTAPSIINGDLSLKSTRNSMLPYTLDNWISGNTFTCGEIADSSGNPVYKDCEVSTIDSSNIIASDNWRYIGRFDWLNNFQRIFYDGSIKTSGIYQADKLSYTNDHFIVNHIITCKALSPLKSLSESFDTSDLGGDIEIKKA